MTTTANESLQRESRTESCETRQFLAISEHSSVKGTPTAIRDWLMSFLPASHVNPSASPASEKVTPTIETSGLKPSMSFAEYDHDSRTWRTYQVSLLTLMPDEFTETWPKAGMTVSGVGYLLPKQELRIAEIDGGVLPTMTVLDSTMTAKGKAGANKMHSVQLSHLANSGALTHSDPIAVQDQLRAEGRLSKAERRLWPTPTVQEAISGHGYQSSNGRDYPTLTGLVGAAPARGGKAWPTPAARDYRAQHAENSDSFLNRQEHPRGVNLVEELQRQGVRGQLNPTWVEWLMGWPLGWTDLKPLEMDKFQQWCEQHGIY